MTVIIRSMIQDDKPEIMSFIQALPEFEPSEVKVAEEVIDSYLDNPESGYHIQVAEAASQLAGYICYGSAPLTEGTWDIYWMAVAPEKQGEGIGRALTTFAEDEIKRAGGRLVIIETSAKPDYEKARRFHHSQGYRVVGRVPHFYAPKDDKLIFWKLLQ